MSTGRCWRPLLLWGAVVVTVAALTQASLARANPPAIVSRESVSAFFGGDNLTLHFTVQSVDSADALARWSFSVEHRVLARGEARLSPTHGRPGELTLRLKAPAVKEGVVLAGQVSIIVTSNTRPDLRATLARPVWFFPKDPFAGRASWLRERKIILFDPPGRTAEIFKAAGLPFQELNNPDAIAELAEGTLIVGEGVSFTSQRGLPEALLRAAARGAPVLCLAPVDGVLPIPDGNDRDLPAPARLAFRRNEIITELDRRLDARGWAEDGKEVASRLVLRGDGLTVGAEVTTAGSGWPWVEIDFSKPGSRIVFCGFALISHWDHGPTPRFLLARALDRTLHVHAAR